MRCTHRLRPRANPEFDRRIQEMVNDWGVHESHELIAEMIVTALRMGSDSVPVPGPQIDQSFAERTQTGCQGFCPLSGNPQDCDFRFCANEPTASKSTRPQNDSHG